MAQPTPPLTPQLASQLTRIILIHTHLPGVVEIDFDGHTNICGTNASGKTTLQRLIPVFYGEQPNRVVPKTRKKFDDFYLPYNNSYLVYEYINGHGNACQVVLTRKSDGGVDYRFVPAGYEPKQLLTEEKGKVRALNQSDWLRRLTELDIKPSHKISATSEFRAIIQNDLSLMRSDSRDNLKLRQTAARYALTTGPQRLRHIEKLVSAVHAKEGKMDTLRTMLATILEEEGHQRPATPIKTSKIRHWLQQMRLYTDLDRLEGDFAVMAELGQSLQQTHAELWQLKPLMQDDEAALKTELAELEATLNNLDSELNEQKDNFAAQSSAVDQELASAEHRLQEASIWLEANQQEYDNWLDKDMAALERDTAALPVTREALQNVSSSYQLLVDAHASQQQDLDTQSLKLRESLDRIVRKNQVLGRELEQKQRRLRTEFEQAESDLNTAFEREQQLQRDNFQSDYEQLTEKLATATARLAGGGFSQAEQEQQALVRARIEDAQHAVDSAFDVLQQTQREEQQLLKAQNQADEQLTLARQRLHSEQKKQLTMEQQLEPEAGSLRHYLENNYENWEHSLGKVLAEPLLARKDLMPVVDAEQQGKQTTILGLQLALENIALPSYATEEAPLKKQLQQQQQAVEQATQALVEAEDQLSQAHQALQAKQQNVSQQQQKLRQAQQERDYARQTLERLDSELAIQSKERRAELAQEQQQLQQQREKLVQQRDEHVAAQRHDFEEQRLELKLDWQEKLTSLDEQLQELQQQVDDKRSNIDSQVKALQAAFNAALAEKGIDKKALQDLREQQASLTEQIRHIESRQDELRRYQEFMAVQYEKTRPTFLSQERELKQQVRASKASLERLTSQWREVQSQLQSQQREANARKKDIVSYLTVLSPQLRQLQELPVAELQPAAALATTDVRERMSRCSESLARREREERQLRALVEQFESALRREASSDFLDAMEHEQSKLDEQAPTTERLALLRDLLHLLQSKQSQVVEQGRTIGNALHNFFQIFDDINRRVGDFGRRLTEVVGDDLELEGLERSEVKISSTIDELGFWPALRTSSALYLQWRESGVLLPSQDYMHSLADVAELLRADEEYSLESLLRLELHLTEGGTDLVIRNDRQLLEASSHGMAYLILCKFLLAFTRLLRGNASTTIHWPIDEIGTLAYHNVEKLFRACEANDIHIVGAFPNPESDVLMLFEHRYLIEVQASEGNEQSPVRLLKRIQPRESKLMQRLQAKQQEATV